MSRWKLHAFVLVALAGLLQIVLMGSEFGLPGHLGLLAASGLFVFIGLRGAPSHSRHGIWLYAAGYAALYFIIVALARDPLLFMLLAMIYAATYPLPAMVGCLFIFAITFRHLAPFSVALFVLLVPAFLSVLGLIRKKYSRFMIGSQLTGFLLLIIAVMD